MTKRLSLLLCAVCAVALSFASAKPTASSASNPIWYFIKFMNGGCVLTAQGSGNQVKTAPQAKNNADQLWRLEGTSTAGYKIISQSGLTLYTNTTAVNGMFSAATSPGNNTLFTYKASTNANYSDGFVITPKSNTSVYMNQWGGAGADKPLGLWNSVDDNCPLTFESEEEFLASLKLASLPLIPMPSQIELLEGSVPLSAFKSITFSKLELEALAEQYAELLGKVTGTSFGIAHPAETGQGEISLIEDPTITHEEGYRIQCLPDASVIISASKPHGFFNALQTLRQLFYDAKFNHDGQMQLIDATDAPLFGYRGFMLDIARHYFDKAEVKKILDVMALYKINKFHWHLTDDQGWRIDIPEYPRLIEVGAIRERSETSASPSPWFYDDTEYGRGMYYTLDDLKEIVDYAARLHIDIMPEIDLPGHMVAAIASYPDEFSCNPKQPIEGSEYKVRVDQGISKDVLNVAKPEVMKFLKCVLGHIADVFPYPIIHIGGDECPTDAWKKLISAGDKQFKTWMSDNGLATADDIQPWLVNELGKWLKENYNKDVVCWNELTNHWKSTYETKPIIMCYSDYGQNAMEAAAKLNLRTIYTGCWPFYLDMYQTYGDHQFDEIYQGGYGNNTLQRCYGAQPLQRLAGKENLCLGVGANLWTETCKSNESAEHQFFPRMLAVAEVGWLPENLKSWPSLQERVQTHFNIFDEMGVNYATHDKVVPTPDAATAVRIEAERLLAEAQPDAVGYPSSEVYQALRTALADFNTSQPEALSTAIAAFKNAPVTQPEVGKCYRIVSASVFYTHHYEGSAMYATNNKVRFHYTQQTEPEEIFQWQAASVGSSNYFASRFTGQRIKMPTSLDQAVSLSTSGTSLRVDAATVGSTSPAYYDYIPGVVTISAKSGYSPNGTTSKRLNGHRSGDVYAAADATVGKPGCWRIVEITDFTRELEALVAKTSLLLSKAATASYGSFTHNGETWTLTAEKAENLQAELVEAATAELAGGQIIPQYRYEYYVSLYAAAKGVKYTPIEDPEGIASLLVPETLPTNIYDLSGRAYNRNAPTTRYVSIEDGKKVIR